MMVRSGESRTGRCVDDGSSIKAAEFSTDNDTLYIWAINSASAAVDIVCFYDVANFPPHLLSRGVYTRVCSCARPLWRAESCCWQLQAEKPSKSISLIPFLQGNSCIVREKDGSMFVAQPHAQGNLSGLNPFPRQSTGMTDTLVACMARGNILISVEKRNGIKRSRAIREYQLEIGQSGLLKIGQPGKDLGSVDHSINEDAHIAVKMVDDGRRMLILCTSKGEVIKYLQQDSHIQWLGLRGSFLIECSNSNRNA